MLHLDRCRIDQFLCQTQLRATATVPGSKHHLHTFNPSLRVAADGDGHTSPRPRTLLSVCVCVDFVRFDSMNSI